MKILKIKGIYSDIGKIELETMMTIDLKDLSGDKIPELPFGTLVELNISCDENDFLSGNNGIVWATYDLRQSEIIQNTLLAQNIYSEIKRIHLGQEEMFLIKIASSSDIPDSIDFIWRNNTGLRLKPDWTYPKGETNRSFEQWLSGH
ncbi:MAG: hypothetical protein WBV81_19950 [Ignavibacteriaceae bacterium]